MAKSRYSLEIRDRDEIELFAKVIGRSDRWSSADQGLKVFPMGFHSERVAQNCAKHACNLSNMKDHGVSGGCGDEIEFMSLRIDQNGLNAR
jgi:hypothetical protein